MRIRELPKDFTPCAFTFTYLVLLFGTGLDLICDCYAVEIFFVPLAPFPKPNLFSFVIVFLAWVSCIASFAGTVLLWFLCLGSPNKFRMIWFGLDWCEILGFPFFQTKQIFCIKHMEQSRRKKRAPMSSKNDNGEDDAYYAFCFSYLSFQSKLMILSSSELLSYVEL